MSKIIIDEKACLKHKLTIPEVLAVLSVRSSKNYEQMMENLFNREILVQQGDNTLVTQHWSEVLDGVLCDSSGGNKRNDKELTDLAIRIMDCFPKGKMKDMYGRDTPYYYRCNKKEVVNSLKRFFVQFGHEYSDDDIADAAKRYVASFGGNYVGMRLAKYFIMKNPVKRDEEGNGYVEQVSDLLTYLERKESEEEVVEVTNSDDWLMSSRN